MSLKDTPQHYIENWLTNFPTKESLTNPNAIINAINKRKGSMAQVLVKDVEKAALSPEEDTNPEHYHIELYMAQDSDPHSEWLPVMTGLPKHCGCEHESDVRLIPNFGITDDNYGTHWWIKEFLPSAQIYGSNIVALTNLGTIVVIPARYEGDGTNPQYWDSTIVHLGLPSWNGFRRRIAYARATTGLSNLYIYAIDEDGTFWTWHNDQQSEGARKWVHQAGLNKQVGHVVDISITGLAQGLVNKDGEAFLKQWNTSTQNYTDYEQLVAPPVKQIAAIYNSVYYLLLEDGRLVTNTEGAKETDYHNFLNYTMHGLNEKALHKKLFGNTGLDNPYFGRLPKQGELPTQEQLARSDAYYWNWENRRYEKIKEPLKSKGLMATIDERLGSPVAGLYTIAEGVRSICDSTSQSYNYGYPVFVTNDNRLQIISSSERRVEDKNGVYEPLLPKRGTPVQFYFPSSLAIDNLDGLPESEDGETPVDMNRCRIVEEATLQPLTLAYGVDEGDYYHTNTFLGSADAWWFAGGGIVKHLSGGYSIKSTNQRGQLGLGHTKPIYKWLDAPSVNMDAIAYDPDSRITYADRSGIYFSQHSDQEGAVSLNRFVKVKGVNTKFKYDNTVFPDDEDRDYYL